MNGAQFALSGRQFGGFVGAKDRLFNQIYANLEPAAQVFCDQLLDDESNVVQTNLALHLALHLALNLALNLTLDLALNHDR